MLQRVKWLPVAAVVLAAAGLLLTLFGVIGAGEGSVVLLSSLVLGVLSLGTR